MTYKIIGLTQDVTTCDCCGKTNLKKTVVLDNGEATVFYGTQCAALTLRGSKKEHKSIEWIAKGIALAKTWLEKGHSIEVVRTGLVNRGWQAEIKKDVLGMWINKTWEPI